MNLILAYIFRNLRKNWVSLLLCVISLTLASSVLYMSLNATEDVLLVARETAEAYTGGFDLSLSPGENPTPLEAIPFQDGDVIVPAKGYAFVAPELGEDVFSLLVATKPEILIERGLASLASGRLPEREGEVLITLRKASFFSLDKGSRLVLVDEETETENTFTVVGILSYITEFSNDRPDLLECIGLHEGGVVPDRVLVDVAAEDIDVYRSFLRDEAFGWNCEVLSDEGTAELSSSMEKILLILVAVTMVLAVSVIHAVSSILIGERLSVYATFRSVGATYSRIKGILLTENLAYGLIGGLCGVVGGECARSFLLKSYFFVSPTGRGFSLLLALVTILFSVVVQLGVSYLSSLRLLKASVRANLSESTSSTSSVSVFGSILGIVLVVASVVLHLTNTNYSFLLGVCSLVLVVAGSFLLLPGLCLAFSVLLSPWAKGPVFLALRNLRGGKTTVSSLRLTTMVVALSTLIAFTVSSVTTFYHEYEKNYAFDAFIKGADLTPSMISYVETHEGIAKVTEEFWKRRDVTVGENTSYVCLVKARGYLNGITCIGCSDLLLLKGQAIVDSQYARQNGIEVGDVVFLQIEGTESPLRVKVMGFCDSGIYNTTRRTIILSSTDYVGLFGEMPTRIDIKFRRDTDMEEVMERLSLYSYLHIDHSVTVGTRESLLGKEVARAESALSVFSMIPVFILVLSIFGLTNNQAMGFRQRKRGYAVLYSVAMDRRQLCILVVAESFAVFVLGTLTGIALGTYLTSVMESIVFSTLAYIRIKASARDLLVPLAVAFVVVMTTTVLPLKRIVGLDVVEEIRNE